MQEWEAAGGGRRDAEAQANLALPLPTPACPLPLPRAGMGVAARYASDKSISTLQLANTGLVSLSYLQKVSEKVGGV